MNKTTIAEVEVDQSMFSSQDVKITKGIMLKRSPIRFWTYQLLGYLTFGFVWQVLEYIPYLQNRFYYSRSQVGLASHILLYLDDGNFVISEVSENNSFVFQKLIYTWNALSQNYMTHIFSLNGVTKEQIALRYNDPNFELSPEERGANKIKYGKNSLQIDVPSFFSLLRIQLMSPYMLVQFVNFVCYLLIQSYANILLIGGILCLIIVFGILSEIRSHKQLRQKAQIDVLVDVFREGEFRSLHCEELLPEDRIVIRDSSIIPCDCLLLEGVCVMNEAILTGETLPVLKDALNDDGKLFDDEKDKRHILYSGTSCVEARMSKGKLPMAIVTKTGFTSKKGEFIRGILYMVPYKFKFETDIVKIIPILFGLGAILTVINLFVLVQQQTSFTIIFVTFVNMIQAGCPPALIVLLILLQIFGKVRLERKKILCSDQSRIMAAGRIRIMCFDKTGTLTEGKATLSSILTLTPPNPNEINDFGISSFSLPLQAVSDIQENSEVTSILEFNATYPDLVKEVMASCHSLMELRTSKVLEGEDVDKEMQERSGLVFRELKDGGEALGEVFEPGTEQSKFKILKRNGFESSEMCMSVLVEYPENPSKYRVFVKGSPEKIMRHSHRDSLPLCCEETLAEYSKKGNRILALAVGRTLFSSLNHTRHEVEKDLVFIGFLLFENKIKEATPVAIDRLIEADRRCVMITGDNPHTATAIAEQCKLLNANSTKVFIDLEGRHNLKYDTIQDPNNIKESFGEPVPIKKTSTSIVENWRDFRSDSVVALKANTLTAQDNIGEVPLDNRVQHFIQHFSKSTQKQDSFSTEFIITGRAFVYISNLKMELQEKQIKNEKFNEAYDTILRRTNVFARMTPYDKSTAVERLKELSGPDETKLVGYVGDGANDCPALKVADVGISISDTEATAAAHLNSLITDISSVIYIIQEGNNVLSTCYEMFTFIMSFILEAVASATLMIYYGIQPSAQYSTFVGLLEFLPLTFCGIFIHPKTPNEPIAKTLPPVSIVKWSVATTIVFSGMFGCLFSVFLPTPQFQSPLGCLFIGLFSWIELFRGFGKYCIGLSLWMSRKRF